MFFILTITLLFKSTSFAVNNEEIEFPGFIALLLLLLRAALAIIFVSISFIIGVLIGGKFILLNIEQFIFNKYELTSLRVFTGSRIDETANALFENVAKWFVVLFILAIIIELIVIIYIAISSVLKTLRQNPRREAEFKKMLKDLILGFIVLFGMLLFIIIIIVLNNVIVSALFTSAKFEGRFQTLTMGLFKDIFSTDMILGTQSLILYIIIAVMGLIFFAYYLRRLLKVSFLIIISPLVAVTFAIDRRTGGAKRLLTWTKEFVYTVFIQTIHALTYVVFLSVVLSDTTLSTTKFVPSIILLVAGLKFVWDSEIIIGTLFGISADKVQSSAAFLMGLMSQAGRLGRTKKTFKKKTPTLRTTTVPTDSSVPSRKRKTKISKKKLETKDKLDVSKQELKDQAKGKKLEGSKKQEEKKKLTDKDIAKAKREEKLAVSVYDKRPFKGLGTAAKDYTITRAKKLGKGTLRRTTETALKTMTKATVAGVTIIASHATPQIGMVEAGLVGVQATDWAINKTQTYRDKKRFDGESKAYKNNLNQEAEQLKAIDERKEKLGKEKELDNKGKYVSELEEESDSQVSSSSTDKEKIKFGTEDVQIDELDAYVKDIADTSKKEIQEAYIHAKKESILAYQKRTGESQLKAKIYVEQLQEDLLIERNFNYDILEDVDKNLLHKYLNVITKDKIDDFEYNTQGRIKYNVVLNKAREIE